MLRKILWKHRNISQRVPPTLTSNERWRVMVEMEEKQAQMFSQLVARVKWLGCGLHIGSGQSGIPLAADFAQAGRNTDGSFTLTLDPQEKLQAEALLVATGRNTNSQFALRVRHFAIDGNRQDCKWLAIRNDARGLANAAKIAIKKLRYSKALGVYICIRFFVKWYKPNTQALNADATGVELDERGYQRYRQNLRRNPSGL